MSKDLSSLEDLFPKETKSKAGEETPAEKLTEKMDEIRIKEKERNAEKLAKAKGLSYVNLVGFAITPEALSLIPREAAEKLRTICFLHLEREIRIATTNPDNPEVTELVKETKEKYLANTELYLVSEHSMDTALKIYDSLPKVIKVDRGVEISEEEFEQISQEIKTFQELDEKLKGQSITKIVTMVIAAAVQSRVSDIHIEAEEEDIKIRFRIDGILHTVAKLEKTLWKKMISRIKLLSGLKINIEDKPQDGRFSIFLKDEKIDVRVSCLPTNYGESVVMRLLMSGLIGIKFEDLGLVGRSFEQLKRETERPNGMIVTTGPTGSGKTTTLYAILNKLNDGKTKIITVEDPIEYQLEGINQSQVDASKDYTFAKGLKSIVRQDPDVVMVGEIRDLETAEIAIQAALTGHLVLSTIHTNSAAGAIPRFMSMGAKGFLLAPATNAMIGQRLVRRICENCKEEAQLTPEQLERATKILQSINKPDREFDLNNLKFYQGKGCEKCNQLKYKGRVGIYEIMTMNPEIEKLILAHQVSEYQIQEIATANGMITMVQDGILKALEGLTSLEEVFRVAEE